MKAIWNGVLLAESDDTVVVEGAFALKAQLLKGLLGDGDAD